jgi:hypothetical protein
LVIRVYLPIQGKNMGGEKKGKLMKVTKNMTIGTTTRLLHSFGVSMLNRQNKKYTWILKLT